MLQTGGVGEGLLARSRAVVVNALGYVSLAEFSLEILGDLFLTLTEKDGMLGDN